MKHEETTALFGQTLLLSYSKEFQVRKRAVELLQGENIQLRKCIKETN